MIESLPNKKQLLILFTIVSASLTYAQVGINNASPKATLDVTAKNTDGSTPEGVIPPRLTGDQIQAANAQYGTDQTGTIIYATSAVTTPDFITENIISAGYYFFDGSIWQSIAGSNDNIYNSDGSLSGNRQVDLASNTLGFTGGNVGIGVATTDVSAVLDVTSTTQGLLPPRVTKAQRDAILSPASGLIIYCTDCSGTISAPIGCLSQNLGNPTTPNWNCIGASTSAAVVVSDCTGFSGSYAAGVPLSGATYALTITNNSFSTSTINFAASDLVLNGITGLTVGNPTFSGGTVSGSNVTITSGQTVVVTYPVTGTPGAEGILTGTWTKLSLTCTNTQLVGKGSATFTLPQNLYIASVDNGGTGDVQGVVDNAANKLTINVPYTAGKGIYDAYTSPWIQNNSGTGQGGDANKFRISYPAGTFSASGSIPVTIEVDGDGSFSALKLSPGNTMVFATLPFAHNGNNDGDIILNIVTCGAFTAPGVFKTFMCHNLGADTSADPFTPSAAIHGAKYQWGAQTNQTGRYYSQVQDQANSGAITGWLTTVLPSNAWDDTTKTASDPCPSGYRVPTRTQLRRVVSSSYNVITSIGTWTSHPTNYSSGLKIGNTLFLPAAGFRDYRGLRLSQRGAMGHYWSTGTGALGSSVRGALKFNSSATYPPVSENEYYGTIGGSVRCISE